MIDGLKNDWMDQWQALSRQYWNAWQDLTREAGAPADAGRRAMPPWHEGFEQWSRMFAGAGKQSETIERVLASAKSFTQFAEAMVAAATAGKAGAMPNWAEAFRNFRMPGGMPGFGNPLSGALGEISGQGVRSFEQLMKNFAPGAFDPMREAKSWLRVPAFGFLREHQEHYQKMASAFVDYQEQNARYNALILEASRRGFALFESKLAAREEPGRQIDSLRALYDLWVDAMEEAYAEIALSPEFRDVYGALVNAQMRVRSEVQQEVERIATDFGMPTRSELDSIGQRLHDLRRELRNGKGRVGVPPDLEREIGRLKSEVASLKAALEARPDGRKSATSKPVPAKAARRPRTRPAKKRAPSAVALRADVEEAVSAPPAGAPKPSAKKGSPAPRAHAKARAPAHAKRLAPRAKKSVAKVAHTPVRVGHPIPTFAERMAAFAKTAHRHTNTKRGGR